MNNHYDTTIAAISTAMSNAGIGIVRMSGCDAFEIADKVYKGKKNKKLSQQQSHTIHYGYITDRGKEIDEVLVKMCIRDRKYIGGFIKFKF